MDFDNASDKVTRCSHNNILLYFNNAPIMFHSMRKNTLDSSTFDSEFVAFIITSELVIQIRYKLCMFGIIFDRSSNLFCDNEYVYGNYMFAKLQLNKKHQHIFFQRVHNYVASGILIPQKQNTKYNLADLLTKSLLLEKHIALRSRIMYSDNLNILEK